MINLQNPSKFQFAATWVSDSLNRNCSTVVWKLISSLREQVWMSQTASVLQKAMYLFMNNIVVMRL